MSESRLLMSFEQHDEHPILSNATQPVVRQPKRVLGNGKRVGCCIVPRDGQNSILVAALVLFPVLVFLTSVIPGNEIFSVVVVCVLTLGSLLSLLFSVTLDPGVLIPVLPDPLRREETVEVNGVSFDCKICTTCNIVRPPRSSHCGTCNWCVEEYDHHCGVLGSCVGKRTFRFFAMFLYFTAASAAYIVARAIVALIQMNYGELIKTNNGRWQLVATFGCVIYCAVGGSIVGGTSLFYVYLSCSNKTQKECNRLQHPHAFDKGFLCNIWKRFCGSLGPSRLDDAPEYV